jgi:16S rRNA (guanine966-N2)-methyltransferase
VRVVGGSARGRKLKAPAGIRPTADMVREAIFDVLETQGADLSRVLDLYAGSGALGIEALSRGDGWCDFVEREAANAAVIRGNLSATGLQERGKVHRLPAARAAARLGGPYSLVLADPPYNDGAALDTIEDIARSKLVSTETTLVLEHSARREPPEQLGPLPLAWTRRYGDTQVSVYRR